ncbi:hypothetical protein QE152_g25410 [Popillia japonica]|uniref:Uncharacterized protein n=1 Tax=Popillia japonica TaxID=7064 RepID=A0AAW1K1N8_POPJA
MSKSENTPFTGKNNVASPGGKVTNQIRRDHSNLRKDVQMETFSKPVRQASPGGKVTNQIRRDHSNLRKDVQMETFSNLASQSKNRKGENNFKLVVKERKRQDSTNRVPLKRIDPGQKSAVNLNKPSGENLKIVNPDESKRLPAGGNFQKDPIKININMIGSGSTLDGFTLTSDSGDLTITNPISSSLITYTQSQTDTEEKLLIHDRSEDVDAYFENFEPYGPMPLNSDEMIFKDSTEAILYDEGLNSEYYRNEIATLKIQLNSLEGRSYNNWQNNFVEGQAYSGSPRRAKKTARSRSASVTKTSKKNSGKKQRSKSSSKSLNQDVKPKNARSGGNSAKESPKPKNQSRPASKKNPPNEMTASKRNPNLLLLNLSRRTPSPNKNLKSSSDAVLIKKDRLKRKTQVKKDLYSPRSADVTLRLSLTASHPSSPVSARTATSTSSPIRRREQSARSKMNDKNQKSPASPKIISPIRKRIDKAITKNSSRPNTPTGKIPRKLPKLPNEITQPQLIVGEKNKLAATVNVPIEPDPTSIRTSSTSSNEYLPHCYLLAATVNVPIEPDPTSIRTSSTSSNEYLPHCYLFRPKNDDILTQYERCRAQCKDIEKVHTKDIGVNCLTRYRRPHAIRTVQGAVQGYREGPHQRYRR